MEYNFTFFSTLLEKKSYHEFTAGVMERTGHLLLGTFILQVILHLKKYPIFIYIENLDLKCKGNHGIHASLKFSQFLSILANYLI